MSRTTCEKATARSATLNHRAFAGSFTFNQKSMRRSTSSRSLRFKPASVHCFTTTLAKCCRWFSVTVASLAQ